MNIIYNTKFITYNLPVVFCVLDMFVFAFVLSILSHGSCCKENEEIMEEVVLQINIKDK